MPLMLKSPVNWKRAFSAFNDEIVFGAGSPVEETKDVYWISPRAGQDFFIAHDLAHYGCAVHADNVRIAEEELLPLRSLGERFKERARRYLFMLVALGPLHGPTATELEYYVRFYADGSPYRENDA